MKTTAAIALGGNLGNVPETFQFALDALQRTDGVSVVARSSNYVTRAIGVDAGNDFINAAALLEVNCEPLELLHHLQRIENELGRVRTVHWGPRTLDVDLIRFDQGVEVVTEGKGERGKGAGGSLPEIQCRMETRFARLILPHPGCWYRRFVLDPWSEIDAGWIHPQLQESVKEMQTRLLRRPLRIGVIETNAEAASLPRTLKEALHRSDVNVRLTSPDRRMGISSLRDDELEMEFLINPESLPDQLSPRTIVLHGENAEEVAIQNLRAALDDPQRLV